MSIGNYLGESLNGLFLVTAQVNNEPASDVWAGWGSVMLVVGGMALTFGIAAIVIWQVFKTRQATIESRATIAREEAYRKLAEESTSIQNRTAAELSHLTEGIADLRVRVTNIERLLREVE